MFKGRGGNVADVRGIVGGLKTVGTGDTIFWLSLLALSMVDVVRLRISLGTMNPGLSPSVLSALDEVLKEVIVGVLGVLETRVERVLALPEVVP